MRPRKRIQRSAVLPLFTVLMLSSASGGAENAVPAAPNWLNGFAVRYRLRVVGGALDRQGAASVLASVPVAGISRSGGADIVVQRADGKRLPVRVRSYDADGEAIIQFPRHGNDPYYWAYVGNDAVEKPSDESLPSMREGMVGEFRRWEGESLESWASVRSGLTKSEEVVGNAILSHMLQTGNPVRPGMVRNVTAQYTGFLRPDKEGAYRLFINGHDAAFLWVDGLMVDQRPGRNVPERGHIPADSVGSEVQLAEGVHAVEAIQAIGDNRRSWGFLGLLWRRPDDRRWSAIERQRFVRAMLACVEGIESRPEAPAPVFSWGIQDVFVMAEREMYLARFQALGAANAGTAAVQWDFGEGRTARGAQVQHLFFEEGEHDVTLRMGDGEAARSATRPIHFWPMPIRTSPPGLREATALIGDADLGRYAMVELQSMLRFLRRLDLPVRWAPLERLCDHLLAKNLRNKRMVADLYMDKMKAAAHQGRGKDAMAARDEALAALEGVDVLRAEVMLVEADLMRDPLRRFDDAAQAYQRILDEFRRLDLPAVRTAAVHYGDLLVDTGDLVGAGEAYEAASDLASERRSAQAEAVSQGALLRVAEQKVAHGQVGEAQQLLDKIERRSPQQKLNGLFRFLRAETARIDERFEQAADDYRLVLRFGEWAGFHDRAMLGLAQCHRRMGHRPEALRWIKAIHESHRGFFLEQNLAEMQSDIEQRLANEEERPTGDEDRTAKAGRVFMDFETDAAAMSALFEPAARVTGGRGIHGEAVASCEAMHSRLDPTVELPVASLATDSHYWIECWYRTLCGRPRESGHRALVVLQIRTPDGDVQAPSQFKSTLPPTFGRWHRLGVLVRTPSAERGTVEIHWGRLTGLLQVDGIRAVPVSRRERLALHAFEAGEVEQQ